MARLVFCVKLNKELEGLEFPPCPGALGKRVFDNISREAWQGWLDYQIMIINEYRLNMAESRSRQYLLEQMEAYLFGEEDVVPAGYVPPQT